LHYQGGDEQPKRQSEEHEAHREIPFKVTHSEEDKVAEKLRCDDRAGQSARDESAHCQQGHQPGPPRHPHSARSFSVLCCRTAAVMRAVCSSLQPKALNLDAPKGSDCSPRPLNASGDYGWCSGDCRRSKDVILPPLQCAALYQFASLCPSDESRSA